MSAATICPRNSRNIKASMRVFFFNLQDSNHRGQSFQLIADSIATIADRELPSTGFMGSRTDLCVKLATAEGHFFGLSVGRARSQ